MRHLLSEASVVVVTPLCVVREVMAGANLFTGAIGAARREENGTQERWLVECGLTDYSNIFYS